MDYRGSLHPQPRAIHRSGDQPGQSCRLQPLLDLAQSMNADTLRLLLALLGAGFQIAGFTWALVDASLARGREFEEYGLPRRIWNWFAFWLGPPPKPQHISVAISESLGLSSTLTAIKSPESDIERLGREIGELSATVQRHHKETNERLATAQNDVQKLTDEMTAQIAKIETRERDRRRGLLRREQRAAQLFIFGLLLTTSTYVV